MHTGGMTPGWDGVSDFLAEDSLESILAITEREPDGVTSPPPRVADVAAAMLARLGVTDTLKLQKLCYYAQARHLVRTGRALFPDRIEAWANGPVTPALFRLHRRAYSVALLVEGDASVVTDNPAALQTVDETIGTYGQWTGAQLSELTHRERPWLEARAGLPANAFSKREITPDAISSFYRTVQQAVDAADDDAEAEMRDAGRD